MGSLGSKTLRVGILGLGRAAHSMALAIRSLSTVSLQAVASRSVDKARDFGQRYQSVEFHGDYDLVIRNDNVDLIYISTAPGNHAEIAKRCLSHGKRVLVEKPFSVNAYEAQQVIECARKTKVFCMEAMWMRFLPAYRELVRSIREGAIGTPQLLVADFGVPSDFVPKDHHSDPIQGGAWLDRGVYGLSLAIDLFGVPIEIASQATIAAEGYDSQSSAILRFGRGELALLGASFTGYSGNEATIAGDLARIRVREPFIRPEILEIQSAPLSGRLEVAESDSLKNRLRQSSLLRRIRSMLPRHDRFLPFQGNGYIHELAECVQCISEGRSESEKMPLQETLHVMEVSDKIRAAWLRQQ